MAPDLFLLSMDKILDDTVSQGSLGINIGAERFTDLDYADDVALQAELCGDVVDSLETMSQEATRFGLEINWTKTKIQPIGVQTRYSTMSWWQATRWSSSAVFAIFVPMWRRMGAAVRRYVGVLPSRETA